MAIINTSNAVVDLKKKTPRDLLQLYAEIMAELKEQNAIRTNNSPVGDYAEALVAKAKGGTLEKSSKKGYDFIAEGKKYQVKARRWSDEKGGIRGERELTKFSNKDFDFLVVVVFGVHFDVLRAYQLPCDKCELKKSKLWVDDAWEQNNELYESLKRMQIQNTKLGSP